MLPDELSEDDSVDMDAEEKAEEEEAKQDKAPTRKSKKGANANLNRQQTKEFNQLIKDSQNLIDELNDMDENHHKDENLCFYHVQKPEEVDKLMDNYDATYENFFKWKDSLLLNINKLSQLHHGEDEHNHEQMIAGAHGAILRSSTKLVEKRNNFLKENIAHLDEDQQKAILEKKDAIA